MTFNVNFLTQNVGLGLVLRNLYGILTEKSYFCALSVTFLRRGCILKLEGLLQGYVKWKNTSMSTFWHKMYETSLMWKLTEKSYFCALSVTFLNGCTLKLEGLLQGYVKWKNTMTFNVNFLTQNDLSISNLYGILTEKSYFCALSVTFLRRGCILKLEGLLQG